MPIYEYACQSCGKHIEVMQKISDAPLAVCEACGGKLEKQWSQTGFQFKGAGWYVTDYAGRGKSETNKTDGGDKGAEAKAETKPDAAAGGETKSEPAKSETKSDAPSTPAPAANAKS